MLEMAKWCVKNPAACADRYAPRVYRPMASAASRFGQAMNRGGRYLGAQAQYAGRRIAQAAPSPVRAAGKWVGRSRPAQRVGEYVQDRKQDWEYKKKEWKWNRINARRQGDQVREGIERRKDRELDERLREQAYCRKFPDDCENMLRTKRIEKLQRESADLEIYADERDRAWKAKKAQREAKRLERDNTFLGAAENFGRFVYDEAKYTAGIDRHKGNPYSERPNTRSDYKARTKVNKAQKKKGGQWPPNPKPPGGP